MNLGSMIQHVNNLSDEDFEPSIVTEFVNDAIARINVECGANFPFVSLNASDVEYPGFNENWQRTLLIPFAVGRSKQKESSQFEYSDAYNQFYASLIEFKSRYIIPEEYKDNNTPTSYEIDLSQSPYRW
jgi:hypothetical protein